MRIIGRCFYGRDNVVGSACGPSCARPKGQDVVILDMHDVTLIADYFVIITGHNTIHVSSLADHVEDMMKNHGVSLFQRVGRERSQWILLDYSDVVVHILLKNNAPIITSNGCGRCIGGAARGLIRWCVLAFRKRRLGSLEQGLQCFHDPFWGRNRGRTRAAAADIERRQGDFGVVATSKLG